MPLDAARDATDLVKAAFFQRYGSDAAPEHGPWNETLALLFRHRSHRAYLDRPLPDGTLETLIGAAQSAASSSNQQSWSVVAVEAPERRAQFAELAFGQKHIAKAPLFLVFLADLSRAKRIAEAQGLESHSAALANDNLGSLENFLVGAVDAALAAQNVVVAAESLGLGTVYIGAIRAQLAKAAEILNLPPLVAPIFGLVVGYPDHAAGAAVKPRLAQSVVLHREAYAAEGHEPAIAAYDEISKAFQASQGQDVVGWTAALTKRFAHPAKLHGRERLLATLQKFGFAAE